MDVANLVQDGSTRDGANARDGGDVLGNLVHQLGHGIVELSNLLLKEVNLLQQAVHLDARSIDQEAHADRLPSRVLNGLGLGLRVSYSGKTRSRMHKILCLQSPIWSVSQKRKRLSSRNCRMTGTSRSVGRRLAMRRKSAIQNASVVSVLTFRMPLRR
jgi:hypothetical protein